MKKRTKIFAQFIIGLVGSIVIGFIGLILGSGIGGNYGFPAFGGVVGWEAGGVFFALLGIAIGGLLSVMLATKLMHKKRRYLVGIIASILAFCMDFLLYDYNMNLAILVLIVVLPSVVITVAMNWRGN